LIVWCFEEIMLILWSNNNQFTYYMIKRTSLGVALLMGMVMWGYRSASAETWKKSDVLARLELRRKQKQKDKKKTVETCGHGQKGRSLVVLYESDVHCSIDGYTKLAGLRDAIADTADVVIVSSGDFLQGAAAGAISKGQYLIDMMRAVGYDAVTLGNHEFDYRMPRMFELLRQLPASVVCANLYDKALERNVFAPYVMKQRGGKRIAFVGAVTPSAMETEAYAFFDGDSLRYDLQHGDVYGMIQQAVDEARENGADYVVVLSHLGRKPIDRGVDSHGLVEKTEGIDVVLDGHTHEEIVGDTLYNRIGKPVVIAQSGTKFANVGKMVISPEGKIATELIPMNELTRENALVSHVADSIRSLLEQVTRRFIGRSDYSFVVEDEQGKRIGRVQETTAGNMVADAFRVMSDADVAVVNAGSIRSGAKAGDLTYGDFVAMLPYDNFLTVVEVRGDSLVNLLKSVTSRLPQPDGQFPQVSGLKFTVHVADRYVTDVQVLNTKTSQYEPIDRDRTYTLATTDYCATGGGLDAKLAGTKIVKEAFILYSSALVEYVEKVLKGHIGEEYAEPQGRITIKY